MEGFGLFFALICMVICVLVIIGRLNQHSDEPEIAPKYFWYVLLSIALGLGLCVFGVLKGSFPIFNSLVGMWFIAWFPISLNAIFFSPRQLLVLPIGYIVLGSITWLYAALSLKDDPPIWYFGDLLFGAILLLGSIGTYFCARKSIRRPDNAA